MKKVLLLLIFTSALLTSCLGVQQTVPPPLPNNVDWETAVTLLHGGEVTQITQLHNLTVTLTLESGQEIKTVEPEIDAIFEEISLCGEPCSDITMATE